MQQRDVHFSVLNLTTLIISDIFSFCDFHFLSLYLYSTDLFVPSASNENLRMKGSEHEYMLPQTSNGIADFKRYSYPLLLEWQSWRPVAHICF